MACAVADFNCKPSAAAAYWRLSPVVAWAHEAMSHTSLSLLERLRQQPDAEAWQRHEVHDG
jgi:hypothetical protein